MITLDPKINAKIDAIDLTLAKQRLMDPKLGEGWSAAKAEEVEKKYKNFLKLVASGINAVPTKTVDIFWHTHILDTKAYAKDCKRAIGRFVHHMPYLAADNLDKAWQQTKVAYQQNFGEPYISKV